MRYTKVATVSYATAAFLAGLAIAFAAWRSRRPASDAPARLPPAAQQAFEAECASCHGAVRDVSGVLAGGGDWKPVADLLLFGRASFEAPTGARTVRDHPTFEDVSDERLAGILELMRAASGADSASGSAIAPRDVATRRSK
jgi:mono/diheme cytochrome c family protein